MTQRMQQAKCTKCESDEQQALSKPMAEALGDRDKTQAKVTGIEQAVSQNEMSIPSNTAIAESSPKLQAASACGCSGCCFWSCGTSSSSRDNGSDYRYLVKQWGVATNWRNC